MSYDSWKCTPPDEDIDDRSPEERTIDQLEDQLESERILSRGRADTIDELCEELKTERGALEVLRLIVASVRSNEHRALGSAVRRAARLVASRKDPPPDEDIDISF